MRKALTATVAGLMLAFGFALVASPAQAAEACKTVTVEGRSGPDSGENGNDWATATLTRTLKVCTAGGATDDWTYNATVTDSGEFVTLAGDSPGAGTTAKLAGGVTGTVNGGFKATFTAKANWDGKETLVTPPAATPTDRWVETAFPGANFTAAGPVAEWRWVYNLCGPDGEWWVNAEAGNSGDITEKACPSPSPTPSETVTESPSPTPSQSESQSPSPSPSTSSPMPSPSNPGNGGGSTPSETAAPSTSNVAGGGSLPVTGESNKGPLIATVAVGMLLISIGGILYGVARRRRAVESY